MKTNGIFPDKLKTSQVIPNYKKMMKHCSQTIDPFHYCHQYQKIFEKDIFNETYKYFQNQNYFLMDSIVLELNTHQNMLHLK